MSTTPHQAAWRAVGWVARILLMVVLDLLLWSILIDQAGGVLANGVLFFVVLGEIVYLVTYAITAWRRRG